jgi:hypothetical protein
VPFAGYVALVASALLCLAAAVVYDPANFKFIGLVLPVLALPWGFLSLALGEAPVWWVVTTVGGVGPNAWLLWGVGPNAWLLWRDARVRISRDAALKTHHDAAV